MSYKQIVAKFGKAMAQDMLMSVEKMAQIRVDEKWLKQDAETRLQRAREALDAQDTQRRAN